MSAALNGPYAEAGISPHPLPLLLSIPARFAAGRAEPERPPGNFLGFPRD
ncbi:MAG: hypothetical protein OXU61_08055 [Gammaproteobacteria bacterium]|nr:hypothetical protein [Gammaproteobacteria bacterium]